MILTVQYSQIGKLNLTKMQTTNLIMEIKLLNIFIFKLSKYLMQDSPISDRKANGRWTQEQHLTFLQGLRVYGKNWKKIQQLIPTRTGTQIRSHAQKFFMKIDQGELKGKEIISGLILNEGEELQSHTDNSKWMSPPDNSRQCSSYYLNKIIEHSTGFGLADFWTALVDWKHEALNKQASPVVHSFSAYSKPLNEMNKLLFNHQQ